MWIIVKYGTLEYIFTKKKMSRKFAKEEKISECNLQIKMGSFYIDKQICKYILISVAIATEGLSKV